MPVIVATPSIGQRSEAPVRRPVDQCSEPMSGSEGGLDIYFPARSVGVEYQGVQHTRPVELFGGEEAFKIQQKRDRNKRALCESNRCALIEVHPGYNLDDVIEAVCAAIKLNSSTAHQ